MFPLNPQGNAQTIMASSAPSSSPALSLEQMMSIIKYLRYLIMHKNYVFVECWRQHLYWRGIWHDMSKFLPDEFFPYVKFFHGKDSKQESKESRYQNIKEAPRYFQRAWQKHLMRNNHHWQNWTNVQDEGNQVVLEMPISSAVEMFCDWIGAGRAQGYYDYCLPMKEVSNWYNKNKQKIILHSQTRQYIENLITKQSDPSAKEEK